MYHGQESDVSLQVFLCWFTAPRMEGLAHFCFALNNFWHFTFKNKRTAPVALQTRLIWTAAVLEPSGCPGVSRSVTYLRSAPAAGLWREDATTASGSMSPQQPIRLSDRCQPHLHTWRTPRTLCCLKVRSCIRFWENSPYLLLTLRKSNSGFTLCVIEL